MGWETSWKSWLPTNEEAKEFKEAKSVEPEEFKSLKQGETHTIIYSGPNPFPEINHVRLFVDCKDTSELKSEGSNLIDANSYLYFQCAKCLNIFDPETKSFKTLHDKAHASGWKLRWNSSGLGYNVYCVECGKDVE
jgi:hypothetical protein